MIFLNYIIVILTEILPAIYLVNIMQIMYVFNAPFKNMNIIPKKQSTNKTK